MNHKLNVERSVCFLSVVVGFTGVRERSVCVSFFSRNSCIVLLIVSDPRGLSSLQLWQCGQELKMFPMRSALARFSFRVKACNVLG